MEKISSGTVARAIILILALVNMALTFFGKNPIDIADDTIYQVCSLLATIGASLVAYWKDNDVTKKAIERKQIIQGIESGNTVLAGLEEDNDDGNI